MSDASFKKSHALARHLGIVSLIFFGIGDILGAGIYSVVGHVGKEAGYGLWVSFLMAAPVALLTAYSYSKMTALYPVSGGAATFIGKTFSGNYLPLLVGVMIFGTGLVSAATATNAFAAYMDKLISLPPFVSKLFFMSVLSFISFWGIRESTVVNIFLTLVEISGLLIVIVVGLSLIGPSEIEMTITNTAREWDLNAILKGATIAFYAFIGFEDLCNLADESKNPKRDIPRAIFIALGGACLLYFTVSFIYASIIPPHQTTASDTPLLAILEKKGMMLATPFAIIASMAIANTTLMNLIMASRLLYGMASEGKLFDFLKNVHKGRQTPWAGVLVSFAFLFILVLSGGTKVLAQTTSLMVIFIFFMVHLSLLKVNLKRKEKIKTEMALSILGMLLCVLFSFYFEWSSVLRALIFVGLATLIGVVKKKIPKR